MKIYILPDGRKCFFDEDKVPAGAVLANKKAEKKTAEKADPKPANKAKKPANKAKKPANKAKKAVDAK